MKLLAATDKTYLFVKTGDGRLILARVEENVQEGTDVVVSFTIKELQNSRCMVEVIGYTGYQVGNKHYFFAI